MPENKPEISLQMKYDGQLGQIDANTLLTTLSHFISVTKEVNSIVNPQQQLEVKVNAFEKGSFIVDLSFLTILGGIFISNIQTIDATLNSVSILFNIKKFLKGKKPQSTEAVSEDSSKIKISDNHGNVYIADTMVFNMYANNETVNDAITKTFQTLSEDSGINKIEVYQGGKGKLIDIPKENFIDMINENELLKSNESTEIFKEEKVNIIKLVFQQGRRWEFVYKGNKVSASISDENFFKKYIESGDSFAKGDILVVDLEITKFFDYTTNAWLNKNYNILRVAEHISRANIKKEDSLFQ